MSSLWLDATARINRGERMVLLFPWHQSPDEQSDLERIDEGYAADSVESWYPIDDHHWYFTRDDLGRLFQETTGIRGDLSFRKTTELRRWLARALGDGEVRAYLWRQPEVPVSFAAQTEAAKAGPEANAWHGLGAYEPEPKAQPKAKAWPANEPTSFAECEERLIAAKQRIADDGFQPKYSDAQLVEIRDKVVIEDRFLVSISTGDKDDSDVVGYRRKDTGRTTAWTAPFMMVEDADLDPELICAKNGMEYKPNKSYTMIIIDRSVPLPDAKESQVIVPTFAAMANLGVAEFRNDGMSESNLRKAMTPEANAKYKASFEDFSASLDDWKKAFDPQVAGQFAADQLTPEEADVFRARHRYQIQMGANQHFLGNGFTKQFPVKGQAGTNKQFGALETMTLEHNPPSVAMRKAAGGIKILTMPAKVTPV